MCNNIKDVLTNVLVVLIFDNILYGFNISDNILSTDYLPVLCSLLSRAVVVGSLFLWSLFIVAHSIITILRKPIT